EAGLKVDACVDINTGKQGRHAPVTGYEIIGPERLTTAYPYSIICMNPNYAGEIARLCGQLRLDVRIYSPEMEPLRLTEEGT
ncbi:MAG: hypothetical protein ACE5ID_12095, partial [Acidobacteriota bacterium]